jgi:predicted SnoaL-like aldol condensation-catalyzing enzyme
MTHAEDEAGSSQHTTGATATLASDYLSALYSGDFDTAQSLVTDDFSFRGPFIETAGKDAFFKSAEGLKRIARGHRLLRQWVDGDDVCSVYELILETPVGTGSVPMSEWHRVRDGRLASGLVLFDSAAFLKFVPAS